MGLVYGDFILRNTRKRGLAPKVVRAFVDTGANILCIPPTLATELQLDEVEKREGWRTAPSTGCLMLGRYSFHSASDTPSAEHSWSEMKSW